MSEGENIYGVWFAAEVNKMLLSKATVMSKTSDCKYCTQIQGGPSRPIAQSGTPKGVAPSLHSAPDEITNEHY